MRPDDLPVLAVLRETLGFQQARQRLIAENVANANTPGYTPRDLDESAFHQALQRELSARRSDSGMRLGSGSRDGQLWRIEESPDSETTINGNSVVLEEQMVNAADNRLRYEMALSLYQKSLGMMRTAIRSPGR